MAPKRVQQLEEDFSSNSECEELVQPPKKTRRTRQEVNEGDIVDGKRASRSTRRKEAMNTDAMEKMQHQVQRMKKKFAKLKAKSNLTRTQGGDGLFPVNQSSESEPDIESEDDDDEAEHSGKFKSAQELPLHNKAQPRPLRREDEPLLRSSPASPSDESEDAPGHGSLGTPESDSSRISGIQQSSARITAAGSTQHTEPSTSRRDHSNATTRNQQSRQSPSEHCLEQQTMQHIKFANGQQPRGRAKASNYEPHIERLIKLAAAMYKTLLVTENAFPSPEEQKVWARECWNKACSMNGEVFDANGLDRLLYAIHNRGSSLRGALKDEIRALAPISLGINVAPSSSNAKSKNRERVRFLLAHKNGQPQDPPRYSYHKLSEFSRFAESNIIVKFLQKRLFKNANDIGVTYESRFNPVPLPMIALALTMICFSIEEWNAGIHTPANFTEETHHESYKTHIKWVNDWAETNPQVTEGIRRNMYTRIRRLCPFEYKDVNHVLQGLSDDMRKQMQDEYAGRTGETDVSSDEEASRSDHQTHCDNMAATA
ncbi:hypothetical protein K474DRAFT_1712072 [Panus rudis PR-1116 ss-1]|nr:hypothetical protein K474DRAFT_1712072 [Panus rudis PR-1116 ss-1]